MSKFEKVVVSCHEDEFCQNLIGLGDGVKMTCDTISCVLHSLGFSLTRVVSSIWDSKD